MDCMRDWYWLDYLLSTKASSVWAIAQFLVLAVSLFFIYRQIKLHRYANMLNIISVIDTRWTSKEFIENRQDICNRYKSGSLHINREEGEILGFFEDMGIFLKKGIFDKEMIWDKYSYYIEHYWAMYKENIGEFRASDKDQTWYERFEYLHQEMAKVSKKKKLNNNLKSQEEISKFIKGELGTAN